MCAKFGSCPMVVSGKKGGVQTDRQRDTVALYSRLLYLVQFALNRSLKVYTF